jgi:hypothetical protein
MVMTDGYFMLPLDEGGTLMFAPDTLRIFIGNPHGEILPVSESDKPTRFLDSRNTRAYRGKRFTGCPTLAQTFDNSCQQYMQSELSALLRVGRGLSDASGPAEKRRRVGLD